MPQITPRWTLRTEGEGSFGRGSRWKELILVSESLGSNAGLCRALRAVDGEEVWQAEIEAPISQSLLVSGDRAYVQGEYRARPDGVHSLVQLLDARNGQSLWETHTDLELQYDPLLIGGKLLLCGCYTRDDPSIYYILALDEPSGEIISQTELPGQPSGWSATRTGVLFMQAALSGTELTHFDARSQTLTALFSLPVTASTMAEAKDRLYCLEVSSPPPVAPRLSFGVSGRSTTDGRLIWQQRFPGLGGSIFASDKALLIIAFAGFAESAERSIVRLDPDSGETIWSTRIDLHDARVADIMGDRIIVQGFYKFLSDRWGVTLALSLSDGREIFRYSKDATSVWARGSESDGMLVVSHGDTVAGLDTQLLWYIDTGTAIHGSPHLAGDRGLVATGGNLLCIDAETGARRWSRRVPGIPGTGPVAEDGVVYLGHSGGVSAFTLQQGLHAWDVETPEPVMSPVLPAGDRLLIGCRDGTVRALRKADGSGIWTFEAGGHFDGGVLHADDQIFAASGSGQIFALDWDGGQRWSFEPEISETDQYRSAATLAGDLLLIGNAGGFVHALGRAAGDVKWKIRLAGGVGEGGILVANGMGWVGDEAGELSMFDIATGERRWTRAVGSPVRGRPCLSGSALLVGTGAGTIEKLNAKTGEPLGSIMLGSSVDASPAVADGRILYATTGSRLASLIGG